MHDHAAGLEPRDRAFVTALVQTSLRRKGECEATMARFLAKKLPRKSGSASLILLLGAAQLLYLETPAHAAIDLAVTLAREDRDARHFANLINAILRKLADVKPIDRPRLNVPEWLWRRWVKTYGENTAEAIARAHLGEPALDLSVKSAPEAWAKTLGGAMLPTGSVRLAERSGAIEGLAGFDEGAWWVQDAAAALPVLLLGNVAGKTALDLCAAPGGKTAQLASRGARVTAVDQVGAAHGARPSQSRSLASLRPSFALPMSWNCPPTACSTPCCSMRPVRPPARSAAIPNSLLKCEKQIAELVALQAATARPRGEIREAGGKPRLLCLFA